MKTFKFSKTSNVYAGWSGHSSYDNASFCDCHSWGPDKSLLFSEKYWYFSYFSMKTYVVGTHSKRLAKALLMSTHNICFHGEIRKISCWYPCLSETMLCYGSEFIAPDKLGYPNIYIFSYFPTKAFVVGIDQKHLYLKRNKNKISSFWLKAERRY